MTRALVTGATGFIGCHLVQSLLNSGVSVRCLVRPSPRTEPLRRLGVQLVNADLSQPSDLRAAVNNCEMVFHLAAKTSAVTRQELYRTNVDGTAAVARACAMQTSPPALVFVSSVAAVGTAIAGRRRREGDRPRPVSEYGRSKRGGERAAIAWAHRVPLSVVRPTIVFGPGNREMLPMFRSVTRYHVHAVPGYTPRRVALIQLDDLTDVLLRIARNGQRIAADEPSDGHGTSGYGARQDPRGYYLATATEFPTYAQLGRMIAQATNTRRLLIMPIAEPFAWMAAAGNQAWERFHHRSGSFNPDKLREAFAGDWTSWPSRLHEEFGFRPRKPLQQHLNDTAEWYRREGWI